MANYTGTRGNDHRTGKAGDDTFDMTAGGDDTVSGNAGNDVINMGATLNGLDHLNGGDGLDRLQLTGDYSAGLTLGKVNFDSVEQIYLGAGFDYDITIQSFTDFSVNRYQTHATVEAVQLGVGDNATVDASAVGHMSVWFHGGKGDDHFIGGSGDDRFEMVLSTYPGSRTGGNDTVEGGAGDDWINYLDSAGTGRVDGGDGDDTLSIWDGNDQTLAPGTDVFQGGAGFDEVALNLFTRRLLTLTADNFGGFEKIDVGYHEHLKLADSVAAAPGPDGYFEIEATGIDDVSVDASAEQDVAIRFTGGRDVASFKGGALGDVFDLFGANHVTAIGGAGDDVISTDSPTFNSGDHITGGGGHDTLILHGTDAAVLSGANGSGFEDFQTDVGLIFRSGAIVAANLVTVSSDSGDGQMFDGSATQSVRFSMTAAGEGDTLIGAAGADTLSASGGYAVLQGKAGADVLVVSSNDVTVTGGAGADHFVFQGDDTVWRGEITDLSSVDFVDLSAIDADATRAGNQAFHLVQAFTDHAGELKVAYYADSGNTVFSMDVDGDGVEDSLIIAAGAHATFTHFVL